MKLNRFFKNPFMSAKISNPELQAFTEDNIAKMQAADGAPHDLSGQITDTGVLYTAYFGENTNVLVRKSLVKAATQQRDIRWKALLVWLAGPGAAEVLLKLGKPSMGYTEFFPQGLTEYHNATVADAQNLASRLQTAVDAHSETLGVPFVDMATGLISSYMAARLLQTGYKGEAADTRGNRDEKKALLQDQLFKNLLSIALLERDPERASLYFSQHLLEDPDHSEDDEEPEEPVEP